MVKMSTTQAGNEAAVPSGDSATSTVGAAIQAADAPRITDSEQWRAAYEIVQADFDRLQIEYAEEVDRHNRLREDHVSSSTSFSVNDCESDYLIG